MNETVRIGALIGALSGAMSVVLASALAFPDGTYVSLDGRDPLAVSRNAGVAFTFEKGRYEVRRDNEVRVRGRYTVNGDEINLTDEEGAWACTDAASSSAIYRWRLADEELVLTPVGQDACNRRRNRLATTGLVRGEPPPLARTVAVPAQLRQRWDRFWRQSDASGWIDDVFDRKAVAEDGNRRLSGIEEIRQWLAGQNSRNPQAFPFDFSTAADRIVEKGRYRDIFGAPDGSTRVLVGRYRITWTRAAGSDWKVTEWILR